MSFKPTAKVIADSINPDGDRITTIVATYHRFIHQEVLTHRVFSRNASSSRAIPIDKQIQKVREDKVFPLHWGRNQPGMVADHELSDLDLKRAKVTWNQARDMAIIYAKELAELGVHKQIVNRVIEPFSSITVIITATEWDNFFQQRCHKDAQPEIQAAAIAIRDAYQKSKPRQLDWGGWHLPFLTKDDVGLTIDDKIKLSTARSARVSYLNHDGTRNTQKDFALYHRLRDATPPHLSPLEHPAIAKPGKWANFKGFRSHRYEMEL